MGNPIKVMTFNVRTPAKVDGANEFCKREGKILRMLAAEKPDLIGFQEATNDVRDFLDKNLPDYILLGHGREKGYRGEGTPIAFRRDRFELHSLRQEWLSDTCDVPASRFLGTDQSRCPRIFVLAELVDRETGELFAFLNVHTDHAGAGARLAECTVLCGKLAQEKVPFIMTGDFNAQPDAPEIRLITGTADSLGTVDATSGITETFHNFGHFLGRNEKIDYVFTNLPVDPAKSYAVPDDDTEGCFYSDHFAVCAFPEL